MPSDLGTESLGPPGLPKQARERPHTGGGLPEPQLPSASRSRPPSLLLHCPSGVLAGQAVKSRAGILLDFLAGAMTRTSPIVRPADLAAYLARHAAGGQTPPGGTRHLGRRTAAKRHGAGPWAALPGRRGRGLLPLVAGANVVLRPFLRLDALAAESVQGRPLRLEGCQRLSGLALDRRPVRGNRPAAAAGRPWAPRAAGVGPTPVNPAKRGLYKTLCH